MRREGRMCCCYWYLGDRRCCCGGGELRVGMLYYGRYEGSRDRVGG